MSIEALVLTLTALFALLFCAPWLSRWAHLPLPSSQFLLGALAAHGAVAAGLDTGLRFDSFHDLVFYLFLPLIIFATSLTINPARLLSQLVIIAPLALFGIAVTAGLVALGLYYGVGHPSGFPWVAALLTGVLLAATDPAAITAQITQLQTAEPKTSPPLSQDKTSPRWVLVIEGESLLNAATAVVLFTVALTAAVSMQSEAATSIDWPGALGVFATELAGGILLGSGCGFFANRFLQLSLTRMYATLFTLATVFTLYHLCLYLRLSGVVAVLCFGLFIQMEQHQTTAQWRQSLHTIWSFIGDNINGVLFILMGVTITASMFTQRWLAMLIAIICVLVARWLSVMLTLAPLRGLRSADLTWREISLLGSLGMRGGITLALVLILPTELPYWWTIQAIAYGVVLFDLFVLAPNAGRLIRWHNTPHNLHH